MSIDFRRAAAFAMLSALAMDVLSVAHIPAAAAAETGCFTEISAVCGDDRKRGDSNQTLGNPGFNGGTIDVSNGSDAGNGGDNAPDVGNGGNGGISAPGQGSDTQAGNDNDNF